MASQLASDPSLSLYRLLDPAVLADPYPLYARLREEDPVHWDPFLHCWVVTRYSDVHQVLQSFSADRTPSPENCSSQNASASRAAWCSRVPTTTTNGASA